MIRVRYLAALGVLWSAIPHGDISDASSPPGSQVAGQSRSADSLAQRADSLIRAGRAWRATVMLAGRLANPATASPDQVIVGARAADAWGGWTEVDRVLRNAPWLDRQYAGEGRELLARSALERGADAVPDARMALEQATTELTRATRQVLLARAHDRANAQDSAATNYLAGATRLGRVADWLRLRSAGATADSAARSALFARLTSAIARARVIPTDAQARERSADFDGAARQFRRANMEGSAFRVEALAARDDAARSALSHRIIADLGATPRNGEVRQSLEILDKLGALSPSDELVAARAAANAGAAARAIAGFQRTSAPLTAPDRMLLAAAQSRTGRFADAARTYALVADVPALAPAAAYQRARALVQAGDGVAARTALRDVIRSYPGIRDAGAPALLLLADLQTDDGDLAGAARTLHDLLARHPTVSQAPLARFRLGLIQWSDAPATAARTFDSLVALHPKSDEALAARYWAGRAYDRTDNHADAELRWQKVIQLAPLSYYAMLAANRLHSATWAPPSGPDTAAHVVAVDSAVTRIALLQHLGMDVEARFEIDALAERADKMPAEASAVAQALLLIGEPARAVRVALTAIDRGPASRALFRIAYPIVHADALSEESRRNGLDPALVAGLIRQESSWNPRAISVASARGLMQLLPSVGASIASAHGYPLWNVALLLEPDVSLELGTAHLASSLKRGAPPARALAAYNAGGSRLARWLQRPDVDDPEVFTEWIPFVETRDYVRIVQRNADVYRALYGLK
ncbi:MAG: transglycosylase SLT domain-containing protein [bacterium]